MGAALLLLAAAAVAAPASTQGTHVLRGRLVASGRVPVDGLVLRVGDYGQAVTKGGGAFTIEIPAGVTSVDVSLVGSEWKVLVPPEGRVPVPLGEEPVTLLIGEPVEKIVLKALADWRRQLDEASSRDAAGMGLLAGQIDEVLKKLGVKERDFEQEVERRRRQAEAYPPVAEAVNAYVLEARDLRGALVSLGPLIEKRPQEAYDALKVAVGEYNNAYTALRTRADGFGASIERDWPDGKLARRDFDDFYRNAVEQTHQTQILPLNEQLVKVQAGLFAGRKDAAFRDAMSDLTRRVDALGPSVNLLGERAARALETLRPGSP
ncbi:MAG TPA: hypothetical protein VLF95_02960 [Vicinamibacteria bacterium]|nr:hypothetical protein [Vicinamibacteria bacterium]